MIAIPESIRIKIGLSLILILSVLMFVDNINHTLTIKRLETANRQLSNLLRIVQAKHPAVKHF